MTKAAILSAHEPLHATRRVVCGEGEVRIHGKVYDVSSFRHPGGSLWMNVVAGTDVTALFESVHLNEALVSEALARLPVVRTEEGTPEKATRYLMHREMKRRMLHVFSTPAKRRMGRQGIRVLRSYLVNLVAWHVVLLCTTFGTWEWWVACVVTSWLNTVMGGYGHNALHRLEWPSVFLDWNGLSCFEWLFEHIVSHHPHVNTKWDHDAISMEPFLRWLPWRPPGWLGDGQGSAARHVVYAVGELVVAWQGFFGHRLRWNATLWGAPWWMCYAPWLFVARWGCLCAGFGWLQGSVTWVLGSMMASFYFSHLAHSNHRFVRHDDDFLRHQWKNTEDLPLRAGAAVLYLDRQRLHHLFPSIDHTRLHPVHSDLLREYPLP